MTREIVCRNGPIAIVDDEDYELVSRYRWYAHIHDRRPSRQIKKVYVHTSIKGNDGRWKTVYLHRLILGLEKGETGDHKNGDTLDNRRGNLRSASRSQQNMNQGRPSHNTSGFKGVSWDKRENKWQAYIHEWPHRKRSLGYFATAQEAAKAYNQAASSLYKEFARPNETADETAHEGHSSVAHQVA